MTWSSANMSYKAKILIVGDDAKAADELTDLLTTRHFNVATADSSDPAVGNAIQQRPDVVIILAGRIGEESGTGIDRAIEITDGLTDGEPAVRRPVIVIGPGVTAETEARCFAAGANIYLATPYCPTQLVGRLQSLIRMATMREELQRRGETIRKYGVGDAFAEIENDEGEARVLAVIRNTDDLTAMEQILGEHTDLAFARSAASALDHLIKRPFDLVALNAGADGEAWRLCRDIRRNSQLFSLPIIVIGDHDELEDSAVAFEAGASDVVYRPVGGAELAARVASFVQEARYQTAMRRVYREAKHFLTSDSLTGLYSYGFALEHLRREIDHAETGGRSLTVAVFNIRAMAAINADHGYVGGDRLIRQIGNLIGTVVRGEDLAARTGGQEFCVVLPDTDSEGAETVFQRISGIVNSTDFFMPESTEPVRIHMRTGRASFEPGDTAEKLIARARAAME